MRLTDRLSADCAIACKLALGWRLRRYDENPRVRLDLGCIFVHIPKAAGSSITEALGRAAPPTLAPRVPRIGKHAKAFEIRALLGANVWDHCFTFAFVRNPWELMVSSYHWWLQKAPRIKYHRARAARVAALGSFEAFLDSPLGRYRINERFGEMDDWFTDRKGDRIVTYVGRVEDLDREWPIICGRIGVAPSTISTVNRSEHRDYHEHYTPRTRERIARRFRSTIERFGYEF